MPRKLHFFALIFSCFFLLTACTSARTAADAPIPTGGQTVQQLDLPADESPPMIAAWIPYFIIEQLLSSPDEHACRSAVTAYLQGLRSIGINTVFVHVCAFGESSYPSLYYPPLPAANGHDSMRIFKDICDALGLSMHAWINPLRLQTAEYMDEQTGDAALVTWYNDPKLRAERLSQWDSRYFLNPAAPSTGKFLSGAVTELIANYHPDGIHIDDYFYPTTETAWDAEEFAASGAEDLAAWRRANITALMKQIQAAAHAADPDVIFSVSPQGSLRENYDRLYADIPAWASAGDCCDRIIPQLYFGYENEYCPFAETLAEWLALPRANTVSMAIGLAPYKLGQPDIYAGSGAQEWSEAKGILARQTADVLLQPSLSGVAYYHSDALLQMPAAEADALTPVLSGR